MQGLLYKNPMTKTPEEIKEAARLLRNKPPAENRGAAHGGHFSAKSKSAQAPQTKIKPARKPSV